MTVNHPVLDNQRKDVLTGVQPAPDLDLSFGILTEEDCKFIGQHLATNTTLKNLR